MNAAMKWLSAAGFGAGLMYFMDPDRGRGRRNYVRDKSNRAWNQSSMVAGRTWRDVSNRAQGVAATSRKVMDKAQHTMNRAQQVVGRGDGSTGTTMMRENWPPAWRAVAGVTGAGMVMWFLRSRSIGSFVAGLGGAAMLTRAVSNRQLSEVARRVGRMPVDIQKTINIAAPREDVFRFWSNYENFPKFMHNIREVSLQGTKDRSHWVANGPGGVPVSWDAETTEMIDNRVIAWKSVPGSTIENAGIVRFEDAPNGTTRVTVRLSYSPPAGEVGHAVLSFLGSDPKHQMDEDLARLKSLLEEGRTSVGGKTVERGNIQQQ